MIAIIELNKIISKLYVNAINSLKLPKYDTVIAKPIPGYNFHTKQMQHEPKFITTYDVGRYIPRYISHVKKSLPIYDNFSEIKYIPPENISYDKN